MYGSTFVRRSTAAFSVVGLLLLASVAFASDWNNNVGMPPGMIDALERDLNMKPDDFTGYLELEREAMKQFERAKSVFGDNYAGSWFERDDSGAFKAVVATTSLAGAKSLLDTLASKNIEVRQVERSLLELEQTVAQVDATAEKASADEVDGVQSWGIDLPSNSIVVTLSPRAASKSVNFFAKSGVDTSGLNFQISEQEPSTMVNVIGGQRYNGCSIGFPVRRGWTQGFVTAGHCGNVNDLVRIQGQSVGRFQRSDFPGADAAWATVRSSDRLYNLVWRYSGNSVYAVTGSQEAPIGATVCRSGFRTGWRCGSITRNNVTVNYAEGPVRGLRESNACAGRGDSGGSWVASGNQAQGVMSGGALGSDGTNCGIPQSQRRSWFQRLNPMLNAYGVTLVTN